MEELDKRTKQNVDYFERNYTPVWFHLNQKEKTYLGNKENRVCRFCGKKDGETSFKNESHAIPEFIGNKVLIANYECDACNSKFSRLLETHFSNYMNLFHTLSQVKGKRGVPSYKSNRKSSRIDIGKESVELKNYENDSISEINEAEKTLTITSTRPSYIPVAVFKCLVKMALTIMPEDELESFEETLIWINEEKHENGEYTFHNLKLLTAFYSGVHPFNFITLGLMKRKDLCEENIPYMIFFVAYSNYFFQIHIPLCQKDSGMTDVTVQFFPAHIALNRKAEEVKKFIIEMKSKTFVRGQKQTVVIQAESITYTKKINSTSEN